MLPMSNSSPSKKRRSVYGEPSPLGIGRKIFLSHSGCDKGFVRFLQQALKHSSYDAFYDEESLPKALPISMHNILQELPSCELGIVVLSDDFFTNTLNPMLELAAMVARQVRLLPLFYKLSVPLFKEEDRRARWMKKWTEKWHIPQDVLTLWTEALGKLGTFNGVEMCIEATNEVTYIDKIVCAVCEALPLAISWSDEHVQGMDRLCQIVAKMYTSFDHNEEHDSIEHSEALVVGMHGFGGVGKSTLCKALCDFYFSQFHGRVCLIDLGIDTNYHHQSQTTGSAALNRLTKVLDKLTNSKLPRDQLDHSQLHNVLRDRIRSGRDPLFLVIDNVQATEESRDEAEFYLNCGPFPSGSKIFITSRSANTLRVLTEPHKFSVVMAFPYLMFHEAKSIFLAKALPALYNHNTDDPLKIDDHALSPEQNVVVDKCVKMCTLHRLTNKYALYADYHPLLLISFASYLRMQSMPSSDPLKWESSIADVVSQGGGHKGLEKVNGMLQKSFELLDEQEQTMFIDLALYMPSTSIGDAQQWLECVYNYQSINIRQSLSKLRNLSFIDDQDLQFVHMHDLLIGFATKKAQGRRDYIYKEDSHCFPDDIMRQLQDAEVHNAPAARCRTRVTISRCRFERPYSTLDLSSWHSIEVLHLLHNQGLEKVLVFSSSLCSLVVQQPRASNSHFETEITVVDQGSWPWHRQEINNGRIRWLVLEKCKIKTKTSILPWPLAYTNNLRAFKDLVHLRMSKVQAFDLDSVGELLHLEMLDLSDLPVRTGLRLDTCTSLKKLRLDRLHHLEFLSGLEKCTNMNNVYIDGCDKIRSLYVPDKDMVEFEIQYCGALERVDVHPPVNHVAITEVGRLGHGGNNTEESEPTECQVDLPCDRAEEETFQEMMQESPSIYSSGNWRARIQFISGGSGLARLRKICLRDAQNICDFILALHVAARVRELECLKIYCKKGAAAGGCGCDTDPPPFGLLHKGLTGKLVYRCARVKDVSSLGNCKLIRSLDLHKCRSVEHWPNFANMTFLENVDLSETSLAQWPQGLASLGRLRVHGCSRLKERELMDQVITLMYKARRVCAIAILIALKLDLHTRKRNPYAVAVSLRSHMTELISLLKEECSFWDDASETSFNQELGELLYELWNMSGFLHKPLLSDPVIIGCIKPLLTDPMIIRSLVRPLMRWKVGCAISYHVKGPSLQIYRMGSGYFGLVLIGLLSIGSCWFDAASVDEDMVKDFIQIVKSFVDRAESSEETKGDELQRTLTKLLDFRDPRPIISDELVAVEDRWQMLDHEQLAVRIADAVCKLARVPKVAAKLGEEFMVHVIHPLEARVEQDYITYLSRVLEMGITKPVYNYGYGYYHWDLDIQRLNYNWDDDFFS